MKSLYDEATYREIKKRLAELNPDSRAEWGSMNPAQMLAHCKAPLNILLGKSHQRLRGNILLKWLFKSQMYSDRPWKKNLPTPRVFKMEEDKDYTKEMNELNKLIDEAYEKRDAPKEKHPVFGKFTTEQWGKMQYKHLDHHLRQFNL